MAQQIKLKATYLAPSKHLGRVISKIVREALPKTNLWKVSTDFNQLREIHDHDSKSGKGFNLYEASLNDSYSSPFNCVFMNGRREDDGYFLQEGKTYTLRGWVDFDIKKNEVSIFYEVMGNVVRDLPTALSMIML